MSKDEWPNFATVDGEPPSEPGVEEDLSGQLAAAYARCFATADGRRVLAHLHRQAFGRILGPEASEALLRHAEGQRQLVAGILAIIRRGSGTRSQFHVEPDK